MNQGLKKKYGLITAICMVVGIAVGSGVFYKAQDMLNYTNRNLPLGILAWIIGGVVMIICALNFATLAGKFEKVNGLVDYTEATVGSGYSYAMAWFLTTIYYPAMTAVLAWLCGRYTLELFGIAAPQSLSHPLTMTLAGFYLILIYALNTLSPKLSGKFQVATTAIKMIPLCLMAIVGTVVGLINGNTVEAFTETAVGSGDPTSLLAAVVAGAFAYEGWIIATSINAEIKQAKRNLPIALIIGCVVIAAIYILYFIGLAGAASVEEITVEGSTTAFRKLFGNAGGTILNLFVVFSCYGVLNGLMTASTRGLYSISSRGLGPKPQMFGELSAHTNMPQNSSIIGLALCSLWLFYFYGANLNASPLFGVFSFDSSELPIITIYAMYIPMFVMFIKKYGKENVWKNIVLPVLAIASCVFMVIAAVYAHGIKPYLAAKETGVFSFPVLFYLIVYAVIMGIGAIFYWCRPKANPQPTQE